LKHKISRKTVQIPLDRLIEDFGLHTVEFGEIGIQKHLFAADRKDNRSKVFRLRN